MSTSTSSPSSPTLSQPAQPSSTQPEAQDFSSWYLSAVTSEFADDIEKLRSATDFKDSSVGILIEALKEGAELFGEEERALVLGMGWEAGGGK
jgi:ribosome assembly protein 3